VLVLRRHQRKRAVVARSGSTSVKSAAAAAAAATTAAGGGDGRSGGGDGASSASTNPLHTPSGRRIGAEPLNAGGRPATAVGAASRAASVRAPDVAWEECFSNSRQLPYWRSRQSGATTWENPHTSASSKPQADADDASLPPGFEAVWSNSRAAFYYRETATGKTTWAKPPPSSSS